MTLSSAKPWRRLRLYGAMLGYGFAHCKDFAREHWEYFESMRTYLRPLKGSLEGLRVLDVGCGKTMWLTLLLHSCGAHVKGIDTERTEPGMGFRKYWGICRRNGVERLARTLAWDVFYAKRYYRQLQRRAKFPLRFDGVDTRVMSANDLDFEDDTFDLVVSHEVFEHLADVEGTVRELNRVLKPDGIAYIYTHNYASISGGHHIAWKYPDTEPSSTVPAWDHLRENRHPEIPSWINRWRENEYRDVFERHFKIVDWIHTAREGEAHLTEEIRRELAEFTERELLTKGFITVGRPIRTATGGGEQ